tara:strand:+ start:940 stop:1101 length:162 start_codon:yes stop_codon:yes gene_type:complete
LVPSTRESLEWLAGQVIPKGEKLGFEVVMPIAMGLASLGLGSRWNHRSYKTLP